jgi:hypothetical protein
MAFGGRGHGTGQYMEIAQRIEIVTGSPTVLVIVIGGYWGDGFAFTTREQGPPIALLGIMRDLVLGFQTNPRIANRASTKYGDLGRIVQQETNARASLIIALGGRKGDDYCAKTSDALAARWFVIWLERIVREIWAKNN